MAEWHIGVPVAWLSKFSHEERDDLWNLWFYSPEDGSKVAVLVTEGDDRSPWRRSNVWKLKHNDDGTITVSPSIHFVGHFHSPNPVTFKLVTFQPD